MKFDLNNHIDMLERSLTNFDHDTTANAPSIGLWYLDAKDYVEDKCIYKITDEQKERLKKAIMKFEKTVKENIDKHEGVQLSCQTTK